MLNISDLSIALQSIEKSYTFPLRETYLILLEPNLPDILPSQN